MSIKTMAFLANFRSAKTFREQLTCRFVTTNRAILRAFKAMTIHSVLNFSLMNELVPFKPEKSEFLIFNVITRV